MTKHNNDTNKNDKTLKRKKKKRVVPVDDEKDDVDDEKDNVRVDDYDDETFDKMMNELKTGDPEVVDAFLKKQAELEKTQAVAAALRSVVPRTDKEKRKLKEFNGVREKREYERAQNVGMAVRSFLGHQELGKKTQALHLWDLIVYAPDKNLKARMGIGFKILDRPGVMPCLRFLHRPEKCELSDEDFAADAMDVVIDLCKDANDPIKWTERGRQWWHCTMNNKVLIQMRREFPIPVSAVPNPDPKVKLIHVAYNHDKFYSLPYENDADKQKILDHYEHERGLTQRLYALKYSEDPEALAALRKRVSPALLEWTYDPRAAHAKEMAFHTSRAAPQPVPMEKKKMVEETTTEKTTAPIVGEGGGGDAMEVDS